MFVVNSTYQYKNKSDIENEKENVAWNIINIFINYIFIAQSRM